MPFVILLLIYLFLSVLYRGFCISLLWGWFLTPLGTAEIDVPHAVGISILVSILTYRASPAKEEWSGPQGIIESVIVTLCLYTFLLGLGWLAHQYM